jgi:hypothetical protein
MPPPIPQFKKRASSAPQSKVQQPSFSQSYIAFCNVHSLPVSGDILTPDLDATATLSVEVDRVKKDEDWVPFMKALRRDTTLLCIHLYSNGPGEMSLLSIVSRTRQLTFQSCWQSSPFSPQKTSPRRSASHRESKTTKILTQNDPSAVLMCERVSRFQSRPDKIGHFWDSTVSKVNTADNIGMGHFSFFIRGLGRLSRVFLGNRVERLHQRDPVSKIENGRCRTEK